MIFTAIMIELLLIAPSRNIALAESPKEKQKNPIGFIEHVELDEASGLAVSNLNPEIIWSHNDSGNAPVLYAMSLNGKSSACFTLEDSGCLDWEDIASYTQNGIPYLLVADTGDNFEMRDLYYLNIIREPSVKATSPSDCDKTIQPDRVIKFRYPDGSHDCEAVAVDTFSDSAILITKRDMPPSAYRVPLSIPQSLNQNDAVTAERIGDVNMVPDTNDKPSGKKPNEKYLRPTSMDISRDGLKLVLLTYSDALLYERKTTKEPWKHALSRPPRLIKLLNHMDKRLPQREAVCFESGADTILLTTEMRPAAIFRFDAGK